MGFKKNMNTSKPCSDEHPPNQGGKLLKRSLIVEVEHIRYSIKKQCYLLFGVRFKTLSKATA